MNIIKGSIIFSIIMLFLLLPAKGYSQTMAIGHITAEVIESISASSLSVANLALSTPLANNINIEGQQTSITSIDNSGIITLNSGNTFAVNVVLKTEPVASSQKNDSKTEVSPNKSGMVTNPKSDSSQSIPINGKSNVAGSPFSGQHPRAYTVVIACN